MVDPTPGARLSGLSDAEVENIAKAAMGRALGACAVAIMQGLLAQPNAMGMTAAEALALGTNMAPGVLRIVVAEMMTVVDVGLAARHR